MTRLPRLERHIFRVQFMGIVNRTPDSFFDGGEHLDETAARARIDQLVDDGADIIDVGAESTRPGSEAIDAARQLTRLGEIIPYAVATGLAVSIDTTEPEVAAKAVEQGASIVNSVSLDPAHELAAVARQGGADLVLTHCRGIMSRMRGFSAYEDSGYEDVVSEVADEWNEAAERARGAGLDDARIVFDPGLGFAKNARQSLRLCAALGPLRERVSGATPRRVLAGVGRKSYLAKTVARTLDIEPPPAGERLGLTVAASIDCARAGVDILRIHDVGPVRQALAYLAEVEVQRAHESTPAEADRV